MITIKEAIDNRLLSPDILNSIPTHCKCGAELQFTESLTELQCTNTQCIYGTSRRLNKLLHQLNITTWTESDCDNICKQFNFTTPFQVFLSKQITDNNIKVDIIDFDKKVKEIEAIKAKEIELWKIVKYANIRYISTLAEKMFSSYDSMYEAYTDIEKGQVSFISEKLGIYNNEPSVLAILIYDELNSHKEELLFAETQFKIIKHTANPIRIAIADSVSGYLNRSDFLNELNNRYYGKVSFVLDSSITEDTKILVVETDNTSTKYRTAKRINERFISQSIANSEYTLSEVGKFRSYKDLLAIGEKVAICKGSELIARLDKVYGKPD